MRGSPQQKARREGDHSALHLRDRQSNEEVYSGRKLAGCSGLRAALMVLPGTRHSCEGAAPSPAAAAVSSRGTLVIALHSTEQEDRGCPSLPSAWIPAPGYLALGSCPCSSPPLPWLPLLWVLSGELPWLRDCFSFQAKSTSHDHHQPEQWNGKMSYYFRPPFEEAPKSTKKAKQNKQTKNTCLLLL